MKILNFGSLNLDYVYSVDHIVEPGETILSTNLDVFPGGKGLNQSIALARAGAQVYHAGMLGPDGGLLLDVLKQNHVDVSYVMQVEERTGNAIIQVGGNGQNSIVLFGGANRKNTKSHVDAALSHFGKGDMILLQNEINLLDYIIEQARQREIKIALNPSPFDGAVRECDLSKVSYFLMNEIEGSQITGQTEPDSILLSMRNDYPSAATILTLGKEGVVYSADGATCEHGIYDIQVADTTAAGDTFTGFFLAALLNGEEIPEALRLASVASSLAVSRKGASPSIPQMDEVRSANLTPYKK